MLVRTGLNVEETLDGDDLYARDGDEDAYLDEGGANCASRRWTRRLFMARVRGEILSSSRICCTQLFRPLTLALTSDTASARMASSDFCIASRLFALPECFVGSTPRRARASTKIINHHRRRKNILPLSPSA